MKTAIVDRSSDKSVGMDLVHSGGVPPVSKLRGHKDHDLAAQSGTGT